MVNTPFMKVAARPGGSGPASFGVDAPSQPVLLGAATLGALAAAVAVPGVRRRRSLRWTAWGVAGFAATVLVNYLHGTLRGKFHVWSDELDRLSLRGDETVVDLGCGRGAVLLAAAARLPQGRAIGVDLWRNVDQSGNSAEATTANAVALGVADRVELHTADLRDLPLPGASADVVVSSLVIHNLHDRAGRDAAVRNAARLLRPGGRLVLVDVMHVPHYARVLAGTGLTEIRHRSTGQRLWWGIPRVLTATKPC